LTGVHSTRCPVGGAAEKVYFMAVISTVRSACRTPLAALAIALCASAALAQSTPEPAPGNSGVGKTTTSPQQVDKGQNMILPSAGESGPSAAPTMVYDCKAKPQDCSTPATPADKAAAPANPATAIKP
jgi:hypothetical protein